MLSAIFYQLDQSKILSSGNGFKPYAQVTQDLWGTSLVTHSYDLDNLLLWYILSIAGINSCLLQGELWYKP